MADQPQTQHEIPFFVDGEQFRAPRGELTVAAILALVGKSVSDFYVVVRHGRDQTEYRGEDTVPIAPGAKLITVSTGPTPVS